MPDYLLVRPNLENEKTNVYNHMVIPFIEMFKLVIFVLYKYLCRFTS